MPRDDQAWVSEVTTRAVEDYGQTHGGRVIAGLYKSLDPVRRELGEMLLAAACQDVNPKFLRFLANDPNVSTAAPTSSSLLDELGVRPQYPRPNGEIYYARKWGEYWDVDVLVRARGESQFALLAGPPGTGKTAMAEAAFGADLVTIVITGETTVGELVGSFIPDGKGGYVWVDGPLLVAVREGRPILVDEILLGDPKVLSVLYPLMDGRGFLDVTENPSIGVVEAKKGFYLLGSGNPNVPGARMSEALTSRFPLQVEVTTDFDLALALGVDDRMVTFSSNLATKAAGRKASISWAPQFRELLAFKKTEEIWGRAFAIKNLMRLVPKQDMETVMVTAQTVFPGTDLKAAKI